MKIVLYGNFNVSFSSETHWANTLQSLGHDVKRIQETNMPTDLVLSESLQSDALVWVHTHGVRHLGSIPITDVLKKLKKVKIPTIAYHLDLYMGLGRWKEYEYSPYLRDVEYFFTVDKLMADWLNENTKVKAYYIPAGVYDKECVMLPKQTVRYEIVFTGSRKYHPEYPYRPQLVDFLKNTYGLNFVHIGNDGEFSQRRGMELNQIYRNAKICVGDTLNLNFSYPYYFSDRLFEQPGRGAFQIFPDIKGVEDMYEDGKEIVLYKHGDLQDLKQKIEYYLEHDTEREAIRQAGFERTKRDHTYINRWKFILETISGKYNSTT